MQEPRDSRTFDPEGLIVPRKLPNPNAESREKKDLHKEMLWKMKYGSNDPKDCELQKAFANIQNKQRLKEIELEKASQMTFEKLLEEQKQRLNSVGVKNGGNAQQAAKNGTNGQSIHSDDHADEIQHLATSTIENLDNVLDERAKHDEFYAVFSKVKAKQLHTAEVGSTAADSAKSIDQRTKAI